MDTLQMEIQEIKEYCDKQTIALSRYIAIERQTLISDTFGYKNRRSIRKHCDQTTKQTFRIYCDRKTQGQSRYIPVDRQMAKKGYMYCCRLVSNHDK